MREQHHQENNKQKKCNENGNEEDDGLYPQYNQRRLIIALVVLIVCFIAAVTSGLLLNKYHNDDDDDNNDDVMRMMKERGGVLVDCMPQLRRVEEKMRKSKQLCLDRGCDWIPRSEEAAPWCVFPKTHDYVINTNVIIDATGKHLTGSLKRSGDVTTSGVKDIFDDVKVDIEIQTNERLRIRLIPSGKPRWEIPKTFLDIEKTSDPKATISTSPFNVTFGENPFGVMVTRKDTGTVVFNSCHPGMLLADQFLQMTTTLPSSHLYGFGEHRHLSLRHNMTWKSWSMFTRDAGPNSDWNLYGQHPVYLNIEDDGKANMVLLKNSNAMEVMLQPDPYPAVTFTTIGGVLDFYIYVGDSPADVTAHYIKSIGLPVFPPYWSLGYHLCRWGYKNITDMQSVVQRTLDANIPYDGQWADIDAFYKYYPFTFDPESWEEFPKYVKKLQTEHGLHFVTIVDPGVGSNSTIIKEIQSLDGGLSTYDMYESGRKAGVFILNAENTEEEKSEVWPGVTVFPDFTNPSSEGWWKDQISHYVDRVGIHVDALWIDMNEPSSFIPPEDMDCRNNTWNYPDYCPDILGAGDDCVMFEKTVCMDAVQNASVHYNVHSLYAHTMAMRTHNALGSLTDDRHKNKRPWTMTRSSFVGTGHFATKWQGDNQATWQDMKYSIISIIEFGHFGFALNGADICGFWYEPTYELCVRWHQLGAFYPFARNHNGRGDEPNFFKHQDPASFGQDFVDIVRPVLMTRYRLLPYIYSCVYRAHTDGHLVMQPLFHQFPQDKQTLSIDAQFLLGPGLLVSPVLEEGATSVTAYFPHGRWYDYMTGEEIRSNGGRTVNLATPLEKYNLHIRGGHVIPWQHPDVTTAKSRDKSMGVIVALDETGKANGELFWDDGESNLTEDNYIIVKFTMEKAGTLNITSEMKTFSTDVKLDTVEVYGLSRMPANVKVGDKTLTKNNYRFINEGIIQINGINHLIRAKKTSITWSMF